MWANASDKSTAPFPNVYNRTDMSSSSKTNSESVAPSSSSPATRLHRTSDDESHLSPVARRAVDHSISIPGNPILPKVVGHSTSIPGNPIRPDDQDVGTFLYMDLNVDRLNRMHQHLWWAGHPYNINTLHRQEIFQRSIVKTETPGFHLLWHANIIFIKPLPPYLLSVSFFDKHIAPDSKLRALALGFLRSYTKLIRFRIDFDIAQDKKLVPGDFTWDMWVRLAPHFIYLSDEDVNMRYIYGELRIPRVNQAHRFWIDFLHPYFALPYTSSKEFVRRTVAGLLLGVVFVTAILTALQLLMTTNADILPLGRTALEKSSWWFSVLCLVAFGVFFGGMLLLLVGSLGYHTWRSVQKMEKLGIDWVGKRRRTPEVEEEFGIRQW